MSESQASLSEDVAQALWDAGCVTVKLQRTFKWASGIKAPLYTDNRVLLSDHEARSTVVDAFVELMKLRKVKVDAIAGVATAGVPWATLIADRMELPLLYVRPEAKKHGQAKQIEGKLERNMRVLLVEDLISTGGSALEAVRALRKARARIENVCAVMSYFPEKAEKKFKKAKTKLHLLTTGMAMLELGHEDGLLPQKKYEGCLEFLAEVAKDY